MSSPFQCVLLIGATSGIGRAMADRLVREGSRVIAVGRRQDKLDDFVRTHGKDKASAIAFDIAENAKIPQFATQVAKSYPELDCLFVNAGVQRRYNFAEPQTIDLDQFNLEMHVNFTSFVAITHAFLPFLLGKQKTELVFTTSNLAIVPAAMLPSYSASKAALNAFVLCLREQLRESTVKVIELSPPVVQTELHDAEMGEEAGRNLGMPIDRFTDLALAGLREGKDQVVIGALWGEPDGTLDDIINKRRTAFEGLAATMRKHS